MGNDERCFYFVAITSSLFSAGVFAQLCLSGILGLCAALQPVSAAGLQRLHRLDVCHHHLQNVVPAEIHKPAVVLQELHHGD